MGETHVPYTFCSISHTHTLTRPYLRRHRYGHGHTWSEASPMHTHTHTLGCTETQMRTARRHETWHSLPWLQTHWMNHPEICPFCPKLLASKSHSAVKSKPQNQWVMLLHVSLTCHAKDKGIIQQAPRKNNIFFNKWQMCFASLAVRFYFIILTIKFEPEYMLEMVFW